MTEQYNVYSDRKVVGNATIKQEGLYYKVSCISKISDIGIYKIILHTNNSVNDLGVCIPRDGLLVLEKKVSVKQIGCGPYNFFLEKKYSQAAGEYMEVYDNMAFAHIEKLNNARFELRDNRCWIWIEKSNVI